MRSGTTLLQQVLCTSPATNSLVHGCRYLVSHIGVYAKYAGTDRLYVDDYLGGAQGLFDFTKDLLDRLLQETHQRLGRPDALVLKSPELSTYFPHAAALFPAARFVISVRDPKDTIASMIKVGERHRQGGVKSFLAGAGRNLNALCTSYRQFYLPVMKAINNGGDELGARVLFVRYEELIGSTETEVRRLSTFCGLSLSSAALADRDPRRSRAEQKADPLFDHPHWSAYMTDLSGGPLSGASIGRHREVLSTEEADRIDVLCADIRQAFGYEAAKLQP
jgi:hypothetical protein